MLPKRAKKSLTSRRKTCIIIAVSDFLRAKSAFTVLKIGGVKSEKNLSA